MNSQTEVAKELASIQLAFMEGNTAKLEVPLVMQRQFLVENLVPSQTEDSSNRDQKKKQVADNPVTNGDHCDNLWAGLLIHKKH